MPASIATPEPGYPRAMSELREVTEKLCRAVDGVDWEASEVEACVRRIHALGRGASPEVLDDALEPLAARLERARVEDGDGVAHAAISAGSLVEFGARPAPLANVLLRKLPTVLEAARLFADRCVAEVGDPDRAWEAVDAQPELLVAEVDGLPIARPLFRRMLAGDRGGGCALAYLEQWTLPTVAALTRDRERLACAIADATLVERARVLRQSAAHWLSVLLAVQLDAPWRVLCPANARGFELRVDGVCTGFDLHALVADALVGEGVPGQSNPRDVIEVVRGLRARSQQGFVKGSFDFHTFRAAGDLAAGRPVGFGNASWNEGLATDIPAWREMRTLLALPPQIARTWNAGRPFSALTASVEVVRRMDEGEASALLAEMARA